MTESQIQNMIRCALSEYGICIRLNTGIYKTTDGKRTIRQGIPGMPDLLWIGDRGRCVWIEVKTTTGRASKAQKRFIETLKRMGHTAGIARSVDDALMLIGGDAGMKVKALDTETMESYTWDVIQCAGCGKWLVDNPQHKYCCFCGAWIERGLTNDD